MKTYLSIAAAIAGLFIVAFPLVTARGASKPPPPVFGGGSTGNWLGDGGNGPIFGFDTLMLGGGFFGGGGNGSNSGWLWEPIGTGSNGGSGGKRCPGYCWRDYPVGPRTPMCDCYQSGVQPGGVGTCRRVDEQFTGTASDCKNDGWRCAPPPNE